MKKNIICISFAIIIVLMMAMLSNIIVVAEKVGQITHTGIYGETVIYVLLFLLIFIIMLHQNNADSEVLNHLLLFHFKVTLVENN